MILPQTNGWIFATVILLLVRLPSTASFLPQITTHHQRLYHFHSPTVSSSFPLLSSSLSLISEDTTLTKNDYAYPWPSEEKHAALDAFYIYHPKNSDATDAWTSLCPPPVSPNPLLAPFFFHPINKQPDVDVTMMWSSDDLPETRAIDIVRECLHYHCDDSACIDSSLPNNQQDPTLEEASMVASVAESLKAFRDFCQTHLPPQKLDRARFKCRLLAATGTSGAKCPQFHIDHVPVRWIQTFVGPGVEVAVGNKGVRWDAFQGENDEAISWTPQERNQQLVDASVADIYSAQPGEAVLILGNEWNQCFEEESTSSISTRPIIQPVVHKSPEILQGQNRVLLTQDIIFD